MVNMPFCLGSQPYLIKFKNFIPQLSISSKANAVALYEDVKKVTENPCSTIFLIDVREPHELQETGILPNSLNIPCKLSL